MAETQSLVAVSAAMFTITILACGVLGAEIDDRGDLTFACLIDGCDGRIRFYPAPVGPIPSACSRCQDLADVASQVERRLRAQERDRLKALLAKLGEIAPRHGLDRDRLRRACREARNGL